MHENPDPMTAYFDSGALAGPLLIRRWKKATPSFLSA